MSNLERYNKVFCNVMQVGEEKLLNLKFKESDYWDSVGHMTLIAALEDEFDIMLDAEDILEFTSYDNAKKVLAKYDIEL